MMAQGMETTSNCAYVGSGCTISGRIDVPDLIVIDGTVEGDLTARFIKIGPSGVVIGNIVANDADISGQVTESLKVKQFLTVRATARLDGVVSYGSLAMERGGVIDGEVICLDVQPETHLGQGDYRKVTKMQGR